MPDNIGDFLTEVTTALFRLVDAATLAVMAGSGFVLMLARRFGPGVVKALK
jgi:hypothetical protein